MFCSDDKHPDDLLLGHMNELVKRSVALGYDPVDGIRVCTYNPVKHYKLEVGLLQVGDPADLIIVDNLHHFNIKETYINGKLVASGGKSLIRTTPGEVPNVFNARPINEKAIKVTSAHSKIKVIKAIDGQLITQKEILDPTIKNGEIISDTKRDILKIIVLNRYKDSKPAIGFIRGFGFKSGAIASTVAHDSHNIIAVGTNDTDLIRSVNLLIQTKGGIVLSDEQSSYHLPLPVAGIMSNRDGKEVAQAYEKINREAKKLGSKLNAPFMTLSFMALLVIPELKLSDMGLFDVNSFSFTSLSSELSGKKE